MLALALCLLAGAAPAPASQEPAAKPKPAVYDETADAGTQLAAALAVARKKNQRVLVQWGANWCGWCIKLADLFRSDRAIARQLLYEYRVVHVDVGRFDKNLELAKRLGADLQRGLPFLTVLDAEGRPLAQQETGSLEAGEKHDPAKLLAFLEQHRAPALNAAKVLAGARARAKEEQKRLLVAFEAPW